MSSSAMAQKHSENEIQALYIIGIANRARCKKKKKTETKDEVWNSAFNTSKKKKRALLAYQRKEKKNRRCGEKVNTSLSQDAQRCDRYYTLISGTMLFSEVSLLTSFSLM